MTLRCLFHIHTRHSLDCLLSPRKVVASARKAGAHVLIVTDHETIRGSEAVLCVAQGNPRFVIRAGEYKTEKGDLIGLFLNEEIRSRKSNDVIQEIRAQGGLVVLPHPFKGHRLDDELLGQIDLVETFNGRCSSEQNESSRALARRLNKPEMAGSDAHCAAEIGAVITEFEVVHQVGESDLLDVFRSASRKLRMAPVSRIYQPYSGLIKACRTFDGPLIGHQLKRMVSVASRELFSS
jgi:predicted metal-dependent phosphoesterase TrpH